ncbi:DNA polymerase III subunit delta [Buchnera aphidicola (Hyperomyzus lactucae)]|uniref:DNA polymerase III subunit delta n=1 Tax=Buchnera aphidicola (Hyperomyzus lactucae) TaxID=1241860 RepID=A0A4D6Y5A3_9GAMM|nr:DNA polymerase III subunit delta [Buchnera aphidicola]QCI21160.1 DNA polymerase III subunit delta [Buchnera aphidicola (Hyperomyzus lactucae)]
MKNIHLYELKEYLTKRLNFLYVFLGEDFFLLNKSQELILNFASQKGFLETSTIDIEKNKDWEKVILFYKKKNLFFQKTSLIINFIIKKLNIVLMKNINKISSLLNSDILMILKFNHLSLAIQKNKSLAQLKKNTDIVSCFTPYNLQFINWIKYEIQEKNINIEEKALFLLCKYYEGDTLFIYNVLSVLVITWPNTYITVDKIKKFIIDFFSFHPFHWINAILEGKIKKAIYILNFFRNHQYDVLVLIRSLQKDLLKLIYMKREKNININMFLVDEKISKKRCKFFIYGFKHINYNVLFEAIQMLVRIEMNIKQKNNSAVWNQLQKITLILC